MFAKSIPSPRYTIKGWECQDSSDKKEFDRTQVIAVADGHGSSDCFRSEVGSKEAIATAFRQSELYCKNACENSDEQIRFSETGIMNFKYAIWQEWRKAVKADWDSRLKNHKLLGEGEVRYETVSDKYKTRFTSMDEDVVERYLYAAYGTTLLFAVAIESQLLLLQIGDGSCVVLQKNGEFCMPVPPDEDNFLNVTVSLCEEDANLKIRHAILDCDPNSPTSPVAVFLSSDGVDDCYPVFRNEQHLYKLYVIILENILKAGFEATEAEIADNLLPGMTAKSSQDDISLAFLVCGDAAILQEAFDGIKLSFKPPSDAPVKEEEDCRQEGAAAVAEDVTIKSQE
jgi:hypothetical protein